MDATELRLRRIELALGAAHKLAELQSHRRLALLGGTMTIGGGATVAASAGQLATGPAATIVLLAAVAGLWQLRWLAVINRGFRAGTREALARIDTLIRTGGERDVDG